MDDFLIEIQESFIAESKELLSNIESLFLKLEKNPNDIESYNSLARLAHNFKGSGKAVGFDAISEFAHEMENLLVALKMGEIKANSIIIDLLLACTDKLKSDLEELSANKSASLNHTELILQIKNILANKSIIETESLSPKETVNADSFAKPIFNKIEKKTNDEFLKIPSERIEFILDAFGEQMILQSALDRARQSVGDNKDLLNRTILQLGKLTYDLQKEVLRLRMVSLQTLAAKLERGVRDASRVANKNIEFVFEGADKELDKTIVDQVGDALLHMVRNSVDHAIESSESRLAKGKPEVGHITVKAQSTGGFFEIRIIDDGQGLDSEKIKSKAIEKGLIRSNEDSYSESEIYNLIFANGFSTKEVTSELSGRGVGMNVVKESVEQLNGNIRIETKKDFGTTFIITLPLSLAIFNGLVFIAGVQKYVIANSAIEEIVRVNQNQLTRADGLPYLVQVRDKSYPVVDLTLRLSKRPSTLVNGSYTTLLVRNNSGKTFAIFVDGVLENQKIVQKKLGVGVENHEGATAATILGDGTVALILDLKHFQPKVSGSNLRSKEAS
jgi:two-component system, chemotaxis family, sensor kinase CheA